METKSLNKRERKAKQLLAHYETCERLARFLGEEKPDGKKISVALMKLEKAAHDSSTAQCNGEAYGGQPYREEKELDAFRSQIIRDVCKVFGCGAIAGLFVNGDARGYALKICNEIPSGKFVIEKAQLHKDWGGFGILSPEITGD